MTYADTSAAEACAIRQGHLPAGYPGWNAYTTAIRDALDHARRTLDAKHDTRHALALAGFTRLEALSAALTEREATP